MNPLNLDDAVRMKNLRRRVHRARRFPANTCSASRHLHLIASQLAAGRPYPMLQEEPAHCAMTMLAVLEALWKARTEVERLKAANAALTGARRPMENNAELTCRPGLPGLSGRTTG